MPGPKLRDKASILAGELDEEQRVRERAGLYHNLLLSVVAAVALQLTVKKDARHWLLTVAILANAVAVGLALLGTRRTKVIEPAWSALLTALGTAAVLAATVRLGVLSPVTALLPVMIFHLSLSDSPLVGRVALLCASVGYFLLATLSLLGMLPLTESVIALGKENPRALIGFTIMLEVLFAGSYVLARRSRQAARSVMERLERSRLQVLQGNSLLTEARAELERAHLAPKPGRWSGRTLSGWVLGDVIGQGAMAEVYAARHSGDGSSAAVKVLHPYHMGQVELVLRFLREATAAASLESPNVVRLLCADRAPDGTPYLVTELLRGRDLAAILREQPRLDAAAAAELVTQVGRGLDVARQAGIVHRDLKPNNVFRAENEARRPVWKILDFGVAAILGDSGQLTRGSAVGTPAYMSPEAARGEPVDHRADVFALAAIAYRAVTGHPAFTAEDPGAILFQVVHAQPVRPSLHTRLHPDVDRVLALGLAKDRAQRIDGAGRFAQAFGDALRGELAAPLRQAADALVTAQPWASPNA